MYIDSYILTRARYSYIKKKMLNMKPNTFLYLKTLSKQYIAEDKY